MSQKHLIFNSSIGSQKPETIVNRQNSCPFCDVEHLTDILDQEGSIIFLKNKYPVLEDTFQTVIIETDDCSSELSEYPKEHLHTLISFGMKHWFEMMNSGEFKSVMFYKNHGPMSGGSLRHPHMQIVGLKKLDAHADILLENFEGVTIDQESGVEFTLSSKPRMGFFEFNVRLSDQEKLSKMADYIQIAAHYVLNHFHRSCTSYNLFFYYLQGDVYAKIVPRFATSPLFVGYGIPQVSNKIGDVALKVKELYLS
ncbi:DUF4931 domain-containing protein [Priestia koreensis]|uniref:DUF4931 domain-containing protein n=1 Tax=Priestia koreensis TaxID=284581 RepID=UPI001F564E29|nr:DUF4931 domain-containing protein [Priestia koreensis]MCM3003054.1 DUF4931 domain-containing protein [Priestia koreensis]UNL85870.1 DUF4931 domain-containing protein [Priestia koreensis]